MAILQDKFKKIVVLLGVMLLPLAYTYGQEISLHKIGFEKTLNNAIIESIKGGALIFADAQFEPPKEDLSYPTYNSDPVLVRVDESGKVLWYRRIKTEEQDLAVAMAILHSGDVMVLSHLNYTEFGNTKSLLVKIDSMGNELWRKEIAEDPGDIIVTSANQILLTTTTPREQGQFMKVSELDKDGNVVWHREFHKADSEGGGFTGLYSFNLQEVNNDQLAFFSRYYYYDDPGVSGTKDAINFWLYPNYFHLVTVFDKKGEIVRQEKTVDAKYILDGKVLNTSEQLFLLKEVNEDISTPYSAVLSLVKAKADSVIFKKRVLVMGAGLYSASLTILNDSTYVIAYTLNGKLNAKVFNQSGEVIKEIAFVPDFEYNYHFLCTEDSGNILLFALAVIRKDNKVLFENHFYEIKFNEGKSESK